MRRGWTERVKAKFLISLHVRCGPKKRKCVDWIKNDSGDDVSNKEKSFLVGVSFLDENNRRESSGNSLEGGMPVRKQSSSSSEE